MNDHSGLLERIRLRLEESVVGIGEAVAELPAADVADLVNRLTLHEAATVMTLLPVSRAVEVLDQPTLRRRGAILEEIDPARAAQILEELSADQRVEIVRQMHDNARRRCLPKLSPAVRAEVEQLLRYPPRTAGAIMTTEFVRLEPTMKVGEALRHIRAVAREKESIYACYVMEPDTGKLLGAVFLRNLVMAEFDHPVAEVMTRRPVTVAALDDQEAVAARIAKYNLLAIPVLEKDGQVVGFVTVDDVIDVMIQESTEDALRMGAVEPGALAEPYIATPFWSLIRKRAGWLIVLFLSEMLTATAMGREVLAGLVLGSILGLVGFLRISLWSLVSPVYGPHWMLVAITVWVSLVGVVLWGTLSGSLLPMLLKRAGLDPAVSSAPFVATLVDVTGIVIYFSVAAIVMRGTLL